LLEGGLNAMVLALATVVLVVADVRKAFDRELDAFRAFVRLYPETVLLVDTYDTLEGVRRVIRLAGELGDGFRVRAVRLDSGDLLTLARETRTLLNQAGLARVQIFASGGLDESEVARLVEQGAPIDAFGVGTAMGVSADAPALDMVYKLTQYAGEGRLKLSAGKTLLPGPKQILREEIDGIAAGDVISVEETPLTFTIGTLQGLLGIGVNAARVGF
jgi:nicotinate phosphoribosyltransferase